jgi:hypothetical protein
MEHVILILLMKISKVFYHHPIQPIPHFMVVSVERLIEHLIYFISITPEILIKQILVSYHFLS